MRALQRAAGNAAVVGMLHGPARTAVAGHEHAQHSLVHDVLRTDSAGPVAVVQRAPRPQALDDPIQGFVTEMIAEADKMIAKTKSLGWRVWSKPARQKHCDDLGTVIDQAEHMIYPQLHNVAATPADERREVDLKALLDQIQNRHLSYVDILRIYDLRPVAPDIDAADSKALESLSRTWSRITSGQGVSISGKPRAFGDDRDPAELAGFTTQILSAHARLLSRQRGRALVTDLASRPGSPAVGVVPYHPGQVEFMGGNTDVGAEAIADSANALAQNEDTAGSGSTSTVAVPYGFKDSEGAKLGEPVTPAFLVYGHELVHAQHNMHGINVRTVDDEELATVSGTAKSDALHAKIGLPRTTEDMLRDEHNLPRRGGYT
ncbi:M91 family zinc metallopeptidase [Pseudonocardia alaniniphila]|uniref:Type III secretion system effector protein n=1 Tax=Pseudonocardia alaniniphila TaxID=75291 RepID=A0ABS9TAR3_9PSEU|nr:M91 family zinc metallopeptidase [Pseudonocardia alaniniphila]MCH6165630.1 type III secretion system effector protein [Pseudonocardia alaniniphila]